MKRIVALLLLTLVLFAASPDPSFTAETFRLDFAAAKTGELPADWSTSGNRVSLRGNVRELFERGNAPRCTNSRPPRASRGPT